MLRNLVAQPAGTAALGVLRCALPPLDPPGCADRRNCNVNLDDRRWARPDLDCELQQARGIPRNLQLDETIVRYGVSWRIPQLVGECVAKFGITWRVAAQSRAVQSAESARGEVSLRGSAQIGRA